MSLTLDHASNRYLTSPAVPGEGAILTLNGSLTRSTDTLQLAVQPFVLLQRFSTGSGSDSNNGSINMSAAWSLEHSKLNLTAGYSDLSTLITELTTTGVTGGTARQEQSSADAKWNLNQSDRLRLDLEASYADVLYVGTGFGSGAGLSSYQYGTVSAGERFSATDHTAVTITASDGELRDPQGLGTSRNEQLSATAEHSFTERFSATASVGISHLIYGSSASNGTVGEITLTRSAGERDQWKLLYQRSVAPSGYGLLVRRDQASLGASHDLSVHLNGGVSVFASRDVDVFSVAPEQSRTYEALVGSLNWRSGETSVVGFEAQYQASQLRTQIGQPTTNARGWQAGISYTWTPKAQSKSR